MSGKQQVESERRGRSYQIILLPALVWRVNFRGFGSRLAGDWRTKTGKGFMDCPPVRSVNGTDLFFHFVQKMVFDHAGRSRSLLRGSFLEEFSSSTMLHRTVFFPRIFLLWWGGPS